MLRYFVVRVGSCFSINCVQLEKGFQFIKLFLFSLNHSLKRLISMKCTVFLSRKMEWKSLHGQSSVVYRKTKDPIGGLSTTNISPIKVCLNFINGLISSFILSPLTPASYFHSCCIMSFETMFWLYPQM